jgi:hypothetical protein
MADPDILHSGAVRTLLRHPRTIAVSPSAPAFPRSGKRATTRLSGLKRGVVLPAKGNANLFECDVMNTRYGVEQHRLTSFRRLAVLAEFIAPLLRIRIDNGQCFRSLRVIMQMS